MLDQLDELYREVILEHFKNPSHSGQISDAQIHVEGANPLCGDELTLYVNLDGDHVTQARFTGKGCAISQAAASMLTAQLEGKTTREIGRLIETMKGLMLGKEPDPSVDLGDLEALAGVRKFPVRVKCAALAWNVVEQALKNYSTQHTADSRQQPPPT